VRIAGFALAALAALGGLVGIGAAQDAVLSWPTPLTEIPAASHCSRMCSAFRRLSCRSVQEDCGRNGELVVVDGDPYNCTEVERVACALYRGDEDCLAACEEGETR